MASRERVQFLCLIVCLGCFNFTHENGFVCIRYMFNPFFSFMADDVCILMTDR